jgi:predicted nucleic acid-binding protein
MTEIFLDTSYAIALSVSNDEHHERAVKLAERLESDGTGLVLCARAFELYRNRLDKEWGLIDCISFIVMEERGITDALTADDHFRQAGFRASLRGS